MQGTPFGRYQLVELLGRGGMGEVWRAFDTGTERVVAVKVLPAHLVDDKLFKQRFRREAKAAASLNEPHVVPIHDFGEINGRLFVAMRLIDGSDLQALLAGGALEPYRTVEIIGQIASALHAAHRIGLVHRDVKPSNILITEDNFAYLIDFGIAHVAEETSLTSTGTTIGTWAYTAPERFDTGTADARSDVYSLACVLFQSLTGRLPFPGDSLKQIAAAHMFKPPPQPSKVQDGVPAAMDQVIATGMAKHPDNRYATTVELADAARDAIAVPVPRATVRHPDPPHDVGQRADAMGQHPTQLASSGPTPVQPLAQPQASPLQAPGRQRNRRTPWIIAGVVVIAALLATAVFGFINYDQVTGQLAELRREQAEYHQVTGQLAELRREQADRDTAAQLAKEYALKSLTYSFEDPDAFFRSVEDGVCEQLKGKYINSTDLLKGIMVQGQATSTGEVLATDPVAQPGGGAYQVVVSAAQTLRNRQSPTPKVSLILLQVTVIKVGNAWQVCDMGPKTGATPPS